MIYVSIIIILVGIFIFIYSILIESSKENKADINDLVERPDRDMAQPDENLRQEKQQVSKTVSYGPIETDRGIAPLTEEINIPSEDTVPDSNETKGPPAPEPEAVLFEDRSNIIDYDSESGIIDSSLEGYRDITRIGKGKIVVEKDGISFYRGKKLHRFDFHRISSLKRGDTYLAISIRGSDSVKLFIMENGGKLLSGIEGEYQEYMRRSE